MPYVIDAGAQTAPSPLRGPSHSLLSKTPASLRCCAGDAGAWGSYDDGDLSGCLDGSKGAGV